MRKPIEIKYCSECQAEISLIDKKGRQHSRSNYWQLKTCGPQCASDRRLKVSAAKKGAFQVVKDDFYTFNFMRAPKITKLRLVA